MSVRKTLLDTVLISSVGVVRLLVQFMALPILSRILSHEDYGVVAMAMPFVFFAMLFADAGISMSLVRTDMSEKRVWATCFWLSSALGLTLAALLALLSPLIAQLLEQPKLQDILRVLGLVLVLMGVGAVPGAYIQKQQRFRAVAATEVTTCLFGLGMAVLTALNGFGLWALVIQQLTQYGTRCVLTFYLSGYRPGLQFRLAEAREHLTFGRDVMGMNLAVFFSRWLDSLIVGKVLGAAAAGVFAMAFQFARLPAMLVSGPLQYVLYAKMSKVQKDADVLRGMFLLFTRGLAMLIFPVMGMVAVSYEPSFALLLSEKWIPAGHIFMLVAPASALQAVTALVATVLLVLGRADLRLRAAVELAVVWVVALLLSAMQGLEAAAIAYTTVSLLYAPRMVRMLLPLIACPGREYWDTLWRPLLLTVAFVALYQAVVQPAQIHELLKLACAAVLALAGIAIGALWQKRALLELAQQLK